VLLEGPYGRLTAGRRTRSKVLLIGAGVGITPMRALFEQLPYRARKHEEVLFRAELDHLAETRKHKVHYLVGHRPTRASDDPFQPSNLVRLVRDLPQHDVFLCGPVPFMDAVTKNLIAAGVPSEQIHSERFDY
jgi:ferredoxin-NADP reductase